MKQRLGTIGAFLLAAAVVYVVGAALLVVWPMWAMMGLGGLGWIFVAGLLALGLAALAATLVSRRPTGVGMASGSRAAVERCPACREPIEPDFVLCPGCHRQLASRCSACGRPLRTEWTRCPYCASTVTSVGADTRPDGGAAAGNGAGRDETHHVERVLERGPD